MQAITRSFYLGLTPRQNEAVALFGLGICLLASAAICHYGNQAYGIGAGIGFLTAVYIVIKES